MKSLGQQGGNRHGLDAKETRESFCKYFTNYGQVAWQNKFIKQVYKSSTMLCCTNILLVEKKIKTF